jgi:hypothetical protein
LVLNFIAGNVTDSKNNSWKYKSLYDIKA